jgi:hypothetical protein
MEGSAKKSLLRRIMRVVMVLVLILLAAVAISWIALRDQILGKVLATVDERLSGSGLYLKVEAHHLTWNGGVMLEGVELYADEGKQVRVAALDDLKVRIPLNDLIRGESRMVVSTRGSELGLETAAGELRLEDLRFKFDVDARSLLIDHFESRFQGLCVTLAGELRWEVDDGRDQEKIVIPDLSWVVKTASWVEFPEGSPTLALSIKPRVAPDVGHDVEAVLSGENFRWKTLPLDKARVRVALAAGVVELSEMSLDGFGGHLSGGMTIDYANDRLVLREVKSSMNPFRLVEALPLGESVGRSMKPFRSLGVTAVSGDGVVFDLAEFSRSTGVFAVESPAGVGRAVKGGEVILTDLHAKVSFSENSLKVEGKSFSLYGGSGSGSFSMPLSKPFKYRANIEGKGISVPRMSKAFGGGEDYTGTMSASYSGGGASGPRSHFGEGRMDVSGGNFYSIPIFGGLRSFLQAKSETFGEDVAGDLGMDFSLKEGVIRSSNLKIESSATLIQVKGQTDHVGKTVNLNLQAKLKGIVGVATGVVSKVMTVHGEGSLDAIHWSLAPLAGFDGSTMEAVGEGVKTAAEKAGSTIQGVGEALKKGVEGTAGKIFGKKGEKDDE